jgi:hypothetical protein
MDEHEAVVRSTGRKVAAHERERDAHVAAVLAALRAGKRPTDVAAWSPFTPSYLRKLARGAHIPPAKKGTGPPG